MGLRAKLALQRRLSSEPSFSQVGTWAGAGGGVLGTARRCPAWWQQADPPVLALVPRGWPACTHGAAAIPPVAAPQITEHYYIGAWPSEQKLVPTVRGRANQGCGMGWWTGAQADHQQD